MHEVLVNRLGGLSLPRKCVVRLTDRPDMTLDVYRGRKTTMQQQQKLMYHISKARCPDRSMYHMRALFRQKGVFIFLFFVIRGFLFTYSCSLSVICSVSEWPWSVMRLKS